MVDVIKCGCLDIKFYVNNLIYKQNMIYNINEFGREAIKIYRAPIVLMVYIKFYILPFQTR